MGRFLGKTMKTREKFRIFKIQTSTRDDTEKALFHN